MKAFVIALTLAAFVICASGTDNGTEFHDADKLAFKNIPEFLALRLRSNRSILPMRMMAVADPTTTAKSTMTTILKLMANKAPKSTKTTTPKTTTPKKTTTTKSKITTQTTTKSTSTKTPRPTDPPIPATLNWTAQGYVTPVKKNNLACMTDWAYSSTGALEGQYFKKTGQLVSLSEENLMDCNPASLVCSGGDPSLAFSYVQNNKGMATEANYPSDIYSDNCTYQESLASGVMVQGYNEVHVNEAQLQTVVATIGPISVAVNIDIYYMQPYTSGIYSVPKCSLYFMAFYVLLVGYGTENGQDYWLLKNSWGTGWGDNGYFKLARNQDNMCGITNSVFYPVL